MRPPKNDPYWEAFINRAPADPNNLIPHGFKQVTPGGVNPVKTEVHSPNVMASHVKDLARFYGANLVGIVDLQDRYGIVVIMRSDYDMRGAAGIGGQAPALKGLFATFTVGAYIRELGYSADASEQDRARVAVAAGLGVLDAEGRLVTREFGTKVHIADVLLTDLPLQPDGRL
jgi:hypothetical protein